MMMGAALFAAEACIGSSHPAVAEGRYASHAGAGAHRTRASESARGGDAVDRGTPAEGKPTDGIAGNDEAVAPLRNDDALSQVP